MTKVFQVTYTKEIGGEGIILVKAIDEAEAIHHASYLCATGESFREAKVVDKSLYVKPRRQGFAGRE